MGLEYRLRFKAPDAEAVVAVLQRLPAVRESREAPHGFDVLGDQGDQEHPAVTVQVEPDGVYFCDHCGGSSRAILGEVAARLVAAFGPVTIDEL